MQVTRTRPLFLNLDDDERLLKPSDMRYAINVETATSYDDDIGALEKSKDPVLVDYTLPSGDNKCIDTIVSEQVNNIYIFIYNSNQNHRIYEYNDQYEVTELVMESSELNFTEYSNVVGDAVRGFGDNEILLFFTDNLSSIRQINVQRAKDGGYGTIDQEKISLIRYQPSQAPSFKYTTDKNYNRNDLDGKVFQFRCRYLGLDGSYSSYSYLSKLAYPPFLVKSRLEKGEFGFVNRFNNIEITVPTGSSIFDKIEVIARLGNEGEWFVIKEINNNTNDSTITFDFKNEGGYPAANPEQTNKYFDNVPIQAESLRVVSNRLFIGNYVDGYDANPSIEEADASDINITPTYVEIPKVSNTNIPVNTASDNIDTYTIIIDIPSLSYEKGDIIRFNIKEVLASNVIWRETFSYLVKDGDSNADIVNALATDISTTTEINQIEIENVNAYNSTNNIVVKIKHIYNFSSGGSTPQLDIVEATRLKGVDTGESLKPGGSYKLGIIEYDEAIRASTIRKIPSGDISVPYPKDAVIPTNNRQKGRVKIDYRIANTVTPLPRTKFWSFAITENLSQSKHLTYTVCGAYEANSSNTPNDPNAFYLNLRSLTGKEDSYIESSGADIDPAFTKGDIVRVIGSMDGNGDTFFSENNFDFEILEAQFYEGTDSPIYDDTSDASKIQTTGYLLKVQDRDAEGYDRAAISSGNSKWNNSGGLVVVEIFRPRGAGLERDEVYYEIGGLKEVVNGRFESEFRESSESLSYSVNSISSSQGNEAYIVPGDTKFVVSDVIEAKDASNNFLGFSFVIDIIKIGDFSFVYVNKAFQGANQIFLTEKRSAGTIEQGDVWYRLRPMRNDNNDGINFDATFEEFPVYDLKASDFIPYEAWSKGRANAYDPLAQERERRSAITYSEPYFQDVDFNGLSSFNIAKGNFKAYPFDSGPIHRLWNNGNFLMVFQENDVARVPINNRIISTSDQQDSLTLSDDVINQERYYAAGYGLTNKDMFAAIDGRFYGYDIKRGKAWEINGQGHTLISEFKVQSHFDEDSKELVSFHNFIDMSVGIDKENDKVLFGTKSKGADNIVSGSVGSSNSYVPGISSNGSNLVFKTKPQNSKSGNLKLSNLQAPLSGYTYPLSNPSTVPQSLNNVVRTGNVKYGGGKLTSGTKNLQLNMPSSGGNVTINATVNLGSGQVTIPTTQSSGNLSLAGNSINYDGFVLGYNYKANRWVSFYSFTPEHFTNINYSVFNFNDGQMFKLNSGNSYPISPVATFETIFNQPRNSVKRFRTLGLATSENSDSEASAGWDVSLNTNLNSTTLSEDLFKKKEGVWRADLPRTTDISGTSAAIGLGIVSSRVGNQVFVSGLDTDILGLNIGDLVSNGNDQNIGSITAIGKDNVTLSTASGINQGDFIFAEKPSFIDGDELRGYFLKARFFAKNSDQQEIYSISVLQQQSNLHHL